MLEWPDSSAFDEQVLQQRLMCAARTTASLEEMTDFVAFERMCCDLLAHYGQYQGIVPQGTGRIDGGKDALLLASPVGGGDGVNVVFHFSLRKDVPAKVRADLAATRRLPLAVTNVVFVTNRRVTPATRDKLIEEARSEFGYGLEIFDQDWLRIPLDGPFQRLRKTYLGIEYDDLTFVPLLDVLSNPRRQPNLQEFESGRYVGRPNVEDRVIRHLKRERVALLGGRPGHGKTSLAFAVGYRIMQENPTNMVFYVSARAVGSAARWLEHIRSADYENAYFILDDCHSAVDETNALIARLPVVSKANILLVYRTIDPAETGPAEESFLDALEAVKTTLFPDVQHVFDIMVSALTSDPQRTPTAQELWETARRTGGDLHLVNYVIAAWLAGPVEQRLTEISYDSILTQVYRRYLAKAHVQEAICALCALSQFEVAMEARWFGSRSTIRLIKDDAYVESVVRAPYGEPIDTLFYFHSTPAAFVLSAAHQAGLLNGVSKERFVKTETLRYLESQPQNFFDVFQALYRGGHHEFFGELNVESSLVGLAEEQIRRLPDQLPNETLRAFLNFVIGISRAKRMAPKEDAQAILRSFVARYDNLLPDMLERADIISLALMLVTAFISPEFQARLIPLLNLGSYAPRAHEGGVRSLAMVVRRARLLRIEKTQIRELVSGLNRGALRDAGEAAFGPICDLLHEVNAALEDPSLVIDLANIFNFADAAEGAQIGFDDLLRFLDVAKVIGIPSPRVNYILRKLNYVEIRSGAKHASFSMLSDYLRLAVDLSISRVITNDILKNVDLASLARRADITTAVSFLSELQAAGISPTGRDAVLRAIMPKGKANSPPADLLTLATGLGQMPPSTEYSPYYETVNGWSWLRIGSWAHESRSGATLLSAFTTVAGAHFLTPRSVAAFIGGLGPANLLRGIAGRYSADVLAAVDRLLKRQAELGCNFKGLPTSIPAEAFFAAFRGRRPVRVNDELKGLQRSLLAEALKAAESTRPEAWAGACTTLRELNSTLQSLLQIATPDADAFAIRVLEGISQEQFDDLLSPSDLFDLSTFLSLIGTSPLADRAQLRFPPEFDSTGFRNKLPGTTLTTVAHLLFDFRKADRASWCNEVAECVFAEREYFDGLIRSAKVGLVGFFLWNLWTASAPSAALNTTVSSWMPAIEAASAQDADSPDGQLGLAGALTLAGVELPSSVIGRIDPIQVVRTLNERSFDPTPTFVRFLVGARAADIDLSRHQKARYAASLRRLDLEVEEPRMQGLTLELILWLEEDLNSSEASEPGS